MPRKVLIVGGVAGGASCAARLRRLDETAQIIMFERGEYISFANCGLPYYIGGVIKEREKLLLQTPKSFKARFNVDVRINSEVVSIDRKAKKVKVKSGGGVYDESYDTLVLSPGAAPLDPGIPGTDSERVFRIWTIPDMDAIAAALKEKQAKSAAVVGGGFIGVEMAENLARAGLSVTLIEMTDQVMPNLDFDMAQMVHKHLADSGVKLVLGSRVLGFYDNGSGLDIRTQSGQVKADAALLSVGIVPNSKLAKDCGLKTGHRGGIIVDEYLRTEDPDIYAIGDAIEVKNFVSGEPAQMPFAGPANRMGRMAADNICGGNRKYKGTLGTCIAKVFDITVASTGLNEKQLAADGKELNKDYKVTILHPLSNAGYYPGGMPLTLKVIFSAEGRVLGAQAVGYKGVDKRIDVIATAMKFGASVFDLEELELCYAPPYSSAKDPVNMAGYTADNILSGLIDNITYGELKDVPKDTVFLDVRTPQETAASGMMPGAINIPVDALRERLGELDKSKPHIVNCAVGLRSYIAGRILAQNGFEVRNFAGGYTTYRTQSGNYTRAADKPAEERGKTVPMGAQGNTIAVDACGLQCPGPVIKLYEAISKAQDGDVINITATDPGFFADAAAWCARTGNTYLKGERTDRGFSVSIKKGAPEGEAAKFAASGNDKSIIVFSGDLDKAIASFIIANGAAAMGRKVTMFFTFWGLNILRRRERVSVKKTLVERMFGFMMPRGTTKLRLSKMNMLGIGSAMMKRIMKKKNVATLGELVEQAKKNGVKIIACTMSMDVMGIHREELIDGIDFAGVASYLGSAETADTNLFI